MITTPFIAAALLAGGSSVAAAPLFPRGKPVVVTPTNLVGYASTAAYKPWVYKACSSFFPFLSFFFY
jgi:hypothetical protein